ncbi:LptF/LptG family permease [Roseiconus lacunae]|uniref:LptF/LptG family permease n=1 Tax=Roseiconus lacunae TaxID=2605694 RepID=A0ABT7PD82_9BACT|nr:LptF/LptG family permease [Roseiconus lacunae]MCD0459747.1 LptF/LptG family permease [Roseiconus lacunae]MDM4014444.1 LptF/LptG family permease [Roseiconus lacunae]
MTQIDRYILNLYLRTFIVSFLSLSGIFIVFHAFTNMTDLAELAEKRALSLAYVMAEFYGPYLLLLFDWTGAIIALMSVLFVVGWLRRTGELTSTLAAGVSHGRLFRAMVVASGLIILVQFASRELLLPSMRDVLSMKNRDITGDNPQPVLPSYDNISGILLQGESIKPRSRVMINPRFSIDGDYEGFGDALIAKTAQWLPANALHDEGYLMQQVQIPKHIETLDSAGVGERAVLMTSKQHDWIGSDECFVVTPVNAEILQTDQSSTRLCSTMHLAKRLRNPAVHNSISISVLLHERLIRVPLDFALVLLGLPLVVNRRDRKLFVTIAAAMGLVVFFFSLKTIGSALGGAGILFSPAIAAWLPLLVLGPFAFMRYREVQTL